MNTAPKCSFRIVGITDDTLSDLVSHHLSEVYYRVGTLHSNTSKKVLRIPLSDNQHAQLLRKLIDDTPSNVGHDFVVSVVSSEQTYMVEIPWYLLDLHHKLGGKIHFSYTCIVDD